MVSRVSLHSVLTQRLGSGAADWSCGNQWEVSDKNNRPVLLCLNKNWQETHLVLKASIPVIPELQAKLEIKKVMTF